MQPNLNHGAAALNVDLGGAATRFQRASNMLKEMLHQLQTARPKAATSSSHPTSFHICFLAAHAREEGLQQKNLIFGLQVVAVQKGAPKTSPTSFEGSVLQLEGAYHVHVQLQEANSTVQEERNHVSGSSWASLHTSTIQQLGEVCAGRATVTVKEAAGFFSSLHADSKHHGPGELTSGTST